VVGNPYETDKPVKKTTIRQRRKPEKSIQKRETDFAESLITKRLEKNKKRAPKKGGAKIRLIKPKPNAVRGTCPCKK
jgi:hypothetical protein